jgi:hypothetical protein
VGVRLGEYARGAIANVKLAIFDDPNTSSHTTKALTRVLRKARLPQQEPVELVDSRSAA